MKRAPTLHAVYAAELRVAQSRLQTQAALQRGRIAFRATLARPASLAAAAGAAAILGYWLARRPRPQSVAAAHPANPTRSSPIAALALAYILQQVKRQLPVLLRHAWAAWQQHAARGDADIVASADQ
jgi:hypothetical protein